MKEGWFWSLNWGERRQGESTLGRILDTGGRGGGAGEVGETRKVGRRGLEKDEEQ